MMKDLQQNTYELKYLNLVKDSNDTSIHSIHGLIDRHAFDAKVDPPKIMNVKFENVYKEFELTFTLSK